jgi:hypothetical protein
MAVTDDIDEALDCIDTLKSALESARDEIEGKDDRITELEEQAGNFSACDVEDCATALLQKYQGGTPSAGDVVRLKEKIEKLLVDEFHVSFGNL